MIDRIVVVQSAAFTGSTWLCYVLASHEKAFSLGNPGIAWELFQERRAGTCRIHYQKCEFWKEVDRRDPSAENFLETIIDVSGCSTLVLYNPRHEPFLSQIADGSLARDLVRTRVIRDIRQRYASWKRRNKDKTVIDAVGGFLTSAKFQKPSDVDENGIVDLRHELLSTDRNYVVEQAASLTGLDMKDDTVCYWKYNHHPAAGNGVTHTTCRHFQNPEKQGQDLDEVYLRYLEGVENGTDFSFDDDRWKSEVTKYEMFVIDIVAGEMNQENGYERDRFSEGQSNEWCARLLKEGIEAGHYDWDSQFKLS